jgi:MinD-like ATPase involved in chromosome partitioning or flagellar assembly
MSHSRYPPDKPWTVCFYSYRGGVGRTTLAVDTALTIARIQAYWSDSEDVKPRSGVFVLDFDLEAPGLDQFKAMRPSSTDQRGLVEYICDFRRMNRAPDLRSYIYQVEPWRKTFPGLFVMRAGRCDDDHLQFLHTMNWDEFLRRENGYLFFDNLLAGIRKHLNCRLVLVDSRTGITGTGGICLGHLADAVVLVFQPNSAHLMGLQKAVRAIRSHERAIDRSIPRLYIANKVRQTYTNNPDPIVLDYAKNIVRECEEGKVEPVTAVLDVLDLDRDCSESEVFNPDRPHLLISWMNDRHPDPCAPDSYLTDTMHPDSDWPIPLGTCVTRWIHTQYRHFSSAPKYISF